MNLPASLDLSLVLACYNEEVIFEQNVREILRTLDQTRWNYEIIFVDDASQDRTRELIDDLLAKDHSHRLSKIFHPHNIGRGGSVADGFRRAQGDVVGFLDIDLEVPCCNLVPCVLALEEGADVATIRRVYRFSWRGLFRAVLTQGYSCLRRRLLAVSLQDTETGFKFFRREKILPLLEEIEDRHWFWDTEVMVRSLLRGYKIVEIPGLFQRRFDKRSTLKPFRDSFDYFIKLWRFRKTVKSL